LIVTPVIPTESFYYFLQPVQVNVSVTAFVQALPLSQFSIGLSNLAC